MQSTGHGGKHSSQPVQLSMMTVCMYFGAPTMASTGQGARQRAQPIQRDSSIHATRGGASTPCVGFKACTGRPKSFARAAMVALPPGGHWLISASPPAIAAAYGL